MAYGYLIPRTDFKLTGKMIEFDEKNDNVIGLLGLTWGRDASIFSTPCHTIGPSEANWYSYLFVYLKPTCVDTDWMHADGPEEKIFDYILLGSDSPGFRNLGELIGQDQKTVLRDVYLQLSSKTDGDVGFWSIAVSNYDVIDHLNQWSWSEMQARTKYKPWVRVYAPPEDVKFADPNAPRDSDEYRANNDWLIDRFVNNMVIYVDGSRCDMFGRKGEIDDMVASDWNDLDI
jgi:hypothetical protein